MNVDESLSPRTFAVSVAVTVPPVVCDSLSICGVACPQSSILHSPSWDAIRLRADGWLLRVHVVHVVDQAHKKGGSARTPASSSTVRRRRRGRPLTCERRRARRCGTSHRGRWVVRLRGAANRNSTGGGDRTAVQGSRSFGWSSAGTLTPLRIALGLAPITSEVTVTADRGYDDDRRSRPSLLCATPTNSALVRSRRWATRLKGAHRRDGAAEHLRPGVAVSPRSDWLPGHQPRRWRPPQQHHLPFRPQPIPRIRRSQPDGAYRGDARASERAVRQRRHGRCHPGAHAGRRFSDGATAANHRRRQPLCRQRRRGARRRRDAVPAGSERLNLAWRFLARVGRSASRRGHRFASCTRTLLRPGRQSDPGRARRPPRGHRFHSTGSARESGCAAPVRPEPHSLVSAKQQQDVQGYKDLWGGLGRLQSDFDPQELQLFYSSTNGSDLRGSTG